MSLSADDKTRIHQWLLRSIQLLGTKPPTHERDVSIRILQDATKRYQSNVLPFRKGAS